jgi:hypothetical protein
MSGPIELSDDMKGAGMVSILDSATAYGLSIKPLTAERMAIAAYRAMERKRRQYEIIAGATVPKDE